MYERLLIRLPFIWLSQIHLANSAGNGCEKDRDKEDMCVRYSGRGSLLRLVIHVAQRTIEMSVKNTKIIIIC